LRLYVIITLPILNVYKRQEFGDQEVLTFLNFKSKRSNADYYFTYLLRTVQNLQKEFQENDEINDFVQKVAPLLSEAIYWRSLPISKEDFLSSRQFKIGNNKNDAYQRFTRGYAKNSKFFRANQDKLYHWADKPTFPVENNFAERELHPIVIAGNISFGSHSDAVTKTSSSNNYIYLIEENGKNMACIFTNLLNMIASKSNKSAFNSLFNS